ncbi:MAG: nitrophenyl compound nitroreductase subunit ArsF family protein [Bacteroidales bacterium]|jgi:hypothetical protein|nr:nitrophenyl compound nitroreductase subunit ArsF family protein [Bacteroidales bacterium]
MKNLTFSAITLLFLATVACNGQAGQKEAATASEKNTGVVEVIYFHNTSRCVTCKTVEAEAKSNIALLYTPQVNEGKISFRSYNIEEPEGKAVADRIGVAGQSLMIVKGDHKENLINDGFMYAIRQPEKFREIMKTKIDPLLK